LRIVAVDTLDDQGYLGAFCPEREINLKRLLGASPGQPTLVFLHHPPVAPPGFALQFRNPARATALVRCIDECSNLVGVLAGHVHCTRTVPLGAVTLSTVPSIATDLSKEKLSDQHVGRPVYHLHTIDDRYMATVNVVSS
jgi:3',5'-cyclic-AMP phosphodiesterase